MYVYMNMVLILSLEIQTLGKHGSFKWLHQINDFIKTEQIQKKVLFSR